MPLTHHTVRYSLLTVLLSALFVSMGCGESPAETDDTVTISSPDAGAMISERRVTIRGQAQGVDTVEVGDDTVDVVAGKWETTREFPEGPAEVVATTRNDRDSVKFTVDSHPPKLNLAAPERAAYFAPDSSVSVEGQASDDGTGLKAIEVQGTVVETDESGKFATDLQPSPGLRVIEVRATDEAGNKSIAHRGIVVGETTAPTSEIEPATNVLAPPETIDTVTEVAEHAARPEKLTEIVKNRVDTEGFEVTAIDYEDLAIDATPEQGYIDVKVTIQQLEVEGNVAVGDEPIPIVVTLEEGAVEGELVPSFDDEGALHIDARTMELQIEPEQLEIAVRDESGNKEEIDRESLRETVVTVAESAFRRLLTEQLADRLYEPGLLRREIEVLGRTFTFQLRPEELTVRERGIFVKADAEMPDDRHEQVPDVPGALVRPRPEPAGDRPDSEGDLAMWTDRTAIERILHGVWRGGLLHQTIGAEALEAYELPFDLNAGALSVAIDGSIDSVAPASTPARIQLRPRLPLATVRSPDGESDGSLWFRAAEFDIAIQLLPEGEEPKTVARLATFLDLSVSAQLEENEIALDLSGRASADLVEEPVVDFDDRELEQLTATLMEAVPRLISDRLTFGSEWEPSWLELQSPDLAIYGPDRDRIQLTVGIDAAAGEAEE